MKCHQTLNRHIIHISVTKKSKTKNNYPIINVYCEMMMYVSNIDIFLRILELTWWRICWILKCRTCWIYSSSSRYGFMLFCSVPSLFSLNAINLLKKLMIMIIKNYLKVYYHHHQNVTTTTRSRYEWTSDEWCRFCACHDGKFWTESA